MDKAARPGDIETSEWCITSRGHVLHRSGLGFRITLENELDEPALESLERWQIAELQAGLNVIDLPARLAVLTDEANQFLKANSPEFSDASPPSRSRQP